MINWLKVRWKVANDGTIGNVITDDDQGASVLQVQPSIPTPRPDPKRQEIAEFVARSPAMYAVLARLIEVDNRQAGMQSALFRSDWIRMRTKAWDKARAVLAEIDGPGEGERR